MSSEKFNWCKCRAWSFWLEMREMPKAQNSTNWNCGGKVWITDDWQYWGLIAIFNDWSIHQMLDYLKSHSHNIKALPYWSAHELEARDEDPGLAQYSVWPIFCISMSELINGSVAAIPFPVEKCRERLRFNSSFIPGTSGTSGISTFFICRRIVARPLASLTLLRDGIGCALNKCGN